MQRFWTAFAFIAFALLAAGCNSSASGSPATDTVATAGPTSTADPAQTILFQDPTPDPNAPTAVPTAVPLVAAEVQLPAECEELAAYAEEQAAIISSFAADTQESVDARAAFNASVFEQELLGCF